MENKRKNIVINELQKIAGLQNDDPETYLYVKSSILKQNQFYIAALAALNELTVDERGLIQKVNMIIATGQNNLAMNRTVEQIAKHFIKGPEIPEGMLNRVEAGIRAFDPCLSCSTHAVGQMPLHIQLLGPEGRLLDEKLRG